jgi:ferredoxin
VPFIDEGGLGALLVELRGRGYELVGPTVRDGTVVLDRIDGIEDLPRGIRETQGPGTYRLDVVPGDRRFFGFAHGPDSAKRYLFPARELVSSAHRRDGRLVIETPAPDAAPRYAFVGIRSCDLHAVEVQDRVFVHGRVPDSTYVARRDRAFFLAVDCAHPGGTCFCASSGTGPRCTEGFDLALTELAAGFLVRVGSDAGADVLAAILTRDETMEERTEAEGQHAEAAASMGRHLDRGDLPALLYRNREHPRWAEVADRCLACSNCTMVCPTCFCNDVVDASDLLGETATRTREWASCFSEEFSHIVGGSVRTSREARYRQWLTHKFSSWIDQFGTSGCVGCGRCITWCPVGIDVTEEIDAIRSTDGLLEEVSP